MNIIYLIGYMGAGKSTLGSALKQYIDAEFIDLDHYIQEQYNKSIGQLFEEYGENWFRTIESEALKILSKFQQNMIIATGGGTPCYFDNMNIMNQSGTTVYLKASPYALCKRLSIPEHKIKRPLIKDKNEAELLQFIKENLTKREAFYNQSKIIFDTENLISQKDVFKYAEKLKNTITNQ